MDRISQLQLPHYTANPTARAGGAEEALKKKSMDMPLPNVVRATQEKATALEGHPPKRHPSRRLQVPRVARPVRARLLRHPRPAGGALAS